MNRSVKIWATVSMSVGFVRIVRGVTCPVQRLRIMLLCPVQRLRIMLLNACVPLQIDDLPIIGLFADWERG